MLPRRKILVWRVNAWHETTVFSVHSKGFAAVECTWEMYSGEGWPCVVHFQGTWIMCRWLLLMDHSLQRKGEVGPRVGHPSFGHIAVLRISTSNTTHQKQPLLRMYYWKHTISFHAQCVIGLSDDDQWLQVLEVSYPTNSYSKIASHRDADFSNDMFESWAFDTVLHPQTGNVFTESFGHCASHHRENPGPISRFTRP